MPVEPCTELLKTKAEAGDVIVEGACGMNVTLTPPAAMTTSDDLMDGAAQAIGQAKMEGRQR